MKLTAGLDDVQKALDMQVPGCKNRVLVCVCVCVCANQMKVVYASVKLISLTSTHIWDRDRPINQHEPFVSLHASAKHLHRQLASE